MSSQAKTDAGLTYSTKDDVVAAILRARADFNHATDAMDVADQSRIDWDYVDRQLYMALHECIQGRKAMFNKAAALRASEFQRNHKEHMPFVEHFLCIRPEDLRKAKDGAT